VAALAVTIAAMTVVTTVVMTVVASVTIVVVAVMTALPPGTVPDPICALLLLCCAEFRLK
jgi:hypothetical protein